VFFFGVFEIIPLIIVGGVLVALFAGRSEPDPDRERPTSLYLSIVSFFGVLFLLGATLAVTTGLVGLTADSDSYSVSEGSFTEYRSGPFVEERRSTDDYVISRGGGNHDDDVSTLATGLIIGVLALGVFRSFFGKIRLLGADSNGPGARVLARYCYAVCFVTLIGALAATGVAIHAVLGIVSPDTFDAGSNAASARMLAQAAVSALVAYALFTLHSGQAQRLAGPARAVGFAPVVAAPPTAAPAAEPTVVAKRAPAKRAAAKKAAPRKK